MILNAHIAYISTNNFQTQVTLQPAEEDQGKPMGVEYSVRTYVAEQEDQKSHKRSSVTLAIKKVFKFLSHLQTTVVTK